MEPVHQVVESVRIRARTHAAGTGPPILSRGIVLAAAAHPAHLDVLLSEETGLPVTLAADPLRRW